MDVGEVVGATGAVRDGWAYRWAYDAAGPRGSCGS